MANSPPNRGRDEKSPRTAEPTAVPKADAPGKAGANPGLAAAAGAKAADEAAGAAAASAYSKKIMECAVMLRKDRIFSAHAPM